MLPPYYLQFSIATLEEWLGQCASAGLSVSESGPGYADGEWRVTPLNMAFGFSCPIAAQKPDQTLRLIWMNTGVKASFTYMLTSGLPGKAEAKEDVNKRERERYRIKSELKCLPSFVKSACEPTKLWRP